MATEVDLALRERLFVEHLLGAAQGVAWRAAQMAGLKGTNKALRVAASRMLDRPKVQAALAEYAAKADVTREKVLATLELHRTADIADVFDIPDEHDPTAIPTINLTRAKKLQRTGAIKRLRMKSRRFDGNDHEEPYTETTIDVELHDSQAAAYKLAQIMGMIIDRKQIERSTAQQPPASLEEWVEKLQAAQIPPEKWPFWVREQLKRKQIDSKVISTREAGKDR